MPSDGVVSLVSGYILKTAFDSSILKCLVVVSFSIAFLVLIWQIHYPYVGKSFACSSTMVHTLLHLPHNYVVL